MTDPGQQVAPANGSWPVYCEIDPDQPAIALCLRCRAFIGKDNRVVNERGLAECRRCRGDVPGSRVEFESRTGNPVGRFVRTARAVLFTPTDFMRRLDPKGRVLPALKFGLVCMILGQLAALLWARLLAQSAYAEFLAARSGELNIPPEQVELLLLTALPFEAIVRLGLSGLLLQLGALLAGARELFRFRDYLRVFSYASAAYLLLFIPLDPGIILAFVVMLIICGRALRIHHRFSTAQTFIATAPLAVGLVLLQLSGGV